MDSNITLITSNTIAIDTINEQIKILESLEDTTMIKQSFKEVTTKMSNVLSSKEILDELKSKAIYQENSFSKERTKENILKAKDRVLDYLRELERLIKINLSENDDIPEDVAIIVLKRILNNFYNHLETMYELPVHGKAGITKDKLDNIKIVNEYDVQRILYSIIKPIFPTARVEVPDDTGFSGVRYDIFIEDYSVIIEVKCSRQSMTEKKLIEEIGSDIFHYQYNNIFFFLYDKEKIIKDKTSFMKTYNTVFGDKKIKTVLIQPLSL